ncbi:GNAT family N-acetyltransferase [Mucilaginibacter conchicola]|uniref:GNAT family N-acetyltransferase n=1 Tax=Mucilaginibacter conchicola TaxID=2303333 RepID=A0A372NYA9_9SPHI|nr:GNAT family N-acetyltransferase [Mucilaginibacter conchicola]RFZ95090.1 GNAT family N-acetyltransferase [Mucilaginibacter conchicola]
MIRTEWIPSAYADSNTPVIRKATLDDKPILLRFEQGVVEAERPFTPEMKAGEQQYYDLDWLLTSPDAYLVVAELNGELIASGYARIDASKPYLKHAEEAYLGFMYVVPQHRGKGLNRLVIDALKQFALSRNITELRLEVYSENASAIKAYEKFGFTSYLLQMRMGLGE